jgi:hypothetical protein
VIGAAVASLSVWLASKVGIEVSPEAQAGLTEGITLLGLFVFSVVYALVHKLANNKLNPADSASSRELQ